MEGTQVSASDPQEDSLRHQNNPPFRWWEWVGRCVGGGGGEGGGEKR